MKRLVLFTTALFAAVGMQAQETQPVSPLTAVPSATLPVTVASLPTGPVLESAAPGALSAPVLESASTTQTSAAALDNARVARAEPIDEREIITRLQIFLDQQRFGPGIIDGRPGEFTFKALGRYQQAHGLPVTKKLEDGAQLPLNTVDPIYIAYTIQEDDLKQVGEVPRKPEFQAKMKRMPYGSLLEFLEERFHASPPFLQKINKDKNMERLKPGDTVWVPNVAPFKIEDVKEIGHLPLVPEFKARRIHVDTKERMLDLFEGDKLIASFPITPGSSKLPAPSGKWHIVGIATLPWFRHDEGVLNYGVRTDHFYNIPCGPNNPVGVVWCGLSKAGIGIHGTNVPETIGRAGSHGCIRVANWDVIRLVSMISEGMSVVIDDGVQRPRQLAPKKKEELSSNRTLTANAGAATKSPPQIPGRETNYANHRSYSH